MFWFWAYFNHPFVLEIYDEFSVLEEYILEGFCFFAIAWEDAIKH